MKVKKLHIDGFGKFRDRTIGPFKNGVNIVVGRNEAGKSTLLRFFHYTLFGYPRSTSDRMPPLEGGAHGGRIEAEHEEGTSFTLERMSGPKGGKMRLIREQGESSDRQAWNKALGYADHGLYKNIYAFSLEELTRVGALEDAGVINELFGAGAGLEGVSVESLENELVEKAEEIYGPRKKKKRFNQLKDRIQEKEEELAQRQRDLPRFNELKGQMAGVDEQLADIRPRTEKARKKSRELEALLKCYDDLIDIRRIDERLHELKEAPDLPWSDSTKLDQLEAEERRVAEECRELRDSYDRTAEEEKALNPDERILEREDEIEACYQGLEAHERDLKALEEGDRALEELERVVEAERTDLGMDMNQADVRAFTGVEELKAKMETLRKRLEKAREREKEQRIRYENSAPRSAIDPGLVLGIVSVALGLIGAAMIVGERYMIGGLVVLMGGVAWYGRNVVKAGEDKETRLKEEWARAEGELEDERKAWRSLLRSYALPEELEPDPARELVEGVAKLQERIREKDKRTETVKEVRERVRAFRKRIEALADPIGSGIDTDPGTELVRVAKKRLEAEKQKRTDKERKREELKRLGKELARKEEQLERVRGEVGEMLEKAGVEDREELREAIWKSREKKELRDKRREHFATIEKVHGAKNGEEVMKELRQWTKDELSTARQEQEEELNRLEDQRSGLEKKKGELAHALEDLEKRGSPGEALTELEHLKTRMNEEFREWLSLRLAGRILQDVRHRYEEEMQPEVVRRTEKYFGEVTGGRYTRIQVPIGEEAFRVRISDHAGRTKGVEELSRGTREQLFLCLRMSLIEQYEKEAEPLPVVMDEVLVNFDPERARKTARMIAEFAENRQVFLFSCHSWVADLFEGPFQKVDLLEG